MTQEEFDKAPLLDQILYDTTGMLVENHKDIAEAMEKYHESKVKNLGLFSVSQQRELLKAIDELKDFAREVCPLHRLDDLDKIIDSL